MSTAVGSKDVAMASTTHHCGYCESYATDIGRVYDDVFEGKLEEACRKLRHIKTISDNENVYFAIVREPLLTDIKYGISETAMPYFLEFSKLLLSFDVEPYGVFREQQTKDVETLRRFIADKDAQIESIVKHITEFDIVEPVIDSLN